MNHRDKNSSFLPRVENPSGRSSILVVCEHASASLPAEFSGLGLDTDQLRSHIAWDPGAYDTAKILAARLDAALISSSVSRLLYDCNRPPEAESAIPVVSEDTVIPGNRGLTEAQRDTRIESFYRPFEDVLEKTLETRGGLSALVTIHSFTPVFRGASRAVEIGILHDSDTRLADALLANASGYEIARNAPYGPGDGVTHTLKRHALPRGLLNVMIEIRNDLIATPAQCAQMAETIATWLDAALQNFDPHRESESAE